MKSNSDRVRKRYKVNVTKRRKFTFEGEDELVKDMVVVLKLSNYTNTQIASIVGVSRGQVKEILQDGNVQRQLMALREKLPQAALELGRAYLIEAVQAVAHVMRTTDDDALVLRAAGELFDRFGIPKVSRSEQKTETPDGGEHPVTPSLMEKLRQASPEVQAKAADLQEMFQEGISQLLDSTDQKVTDGDS
jgi:hypothetical protein